MRPAVIEPRANEDARLTPWADPEELLEQFGFDGKLSCESIERE